VPGLVFTIGIFTVAFLAILSSINVSVYLICASLVWIAIFDDVHHLLLHFAGIVGLFLSAGVAVYQSPSPSNRLVLLLFATALYLFRVALKVSMIILYEFDTLPMRDLSALIHLVYRKHMDIQFRGEAACTSPSLVMPAFKISAVLQWVVFYTLSFVF
jgi:hypothetical protein